MATFVLDPTTDTVASVPRLNRFQKKHYVDKQYKGGVEAWKKKLASSSTIYVGNLSYYTSECQLYELFGRCGSIKRIIMGLDKNKKTPCGFCFIEFDERESAQLCTQLLNGIPLDNRELAVNIDAGFVEGRQFGRGASGGQVGDEKRSQTNYNGGHRGGVDGAPLLTRSITIVACLALISLLAILSPASPVQSEIIIRPFGSSTHGDQLLNPIAIRRAQLGETRVQFERTFANFLVNIMKAAKPTLMQAFIQATLADKQLKDIAIKMFFNNTDSDSD